MGADTRSMRPWVRPAVVALLVAAALFAAYRLGAGESLARLRAWIVALGPWGPIVFVLLYAAAVTLAVPASLLTVAAGAMFGSVVGVVAVSIAATLGAAGAFALARWAARDAIARWLGGSAKFQRLDALTERHGAILVALTRLVPLFPFTLLNYGFGLTRVRFWTYLFWSWLCMLPGTVVYVVGGDALGRGLAERRVPWPLVGVLAVAVVGLALLAHRARRALAEREAASASGEETGR